MSEPMTKLELLERRLEAQDELIETLRETTKSLRAAREEIWEEQVKLRSMKDKLAERAEAIRCELVTANSEVKRLVTREEQRLMSEEINKRERILDAIRHAREVQEFLWDDAPERYDMNTWLSILQKRIDKLREVDLGREHCNVELRKRLLQTAAVSIRWMETLADE